MHKSAIHMWTRNLEWKTGNFFIICLLTIRPSYLFLCFLCSFFNSVTNKQYSRHFKESKVSSIPDMEHNHPSTTSATIYDHLKQRRAHIAVELSYSWWVFSGVSLKWKQKQKKCAWLKKKIVRCWLSSTSTSIPNALHHRRK